MTATNLRNHGRLFHITKERPFHLAIQVQCSHAALTPATENLQTKPWELKVFIKMLLPVKTQWIAISALVSAHNPVPVLEMCPLPLRSSGQLGRFSKWGQDLPICYQCLEPKNTCLDVQW